MLQHNLEAREEKIGEIFSRSEDERTISARTNNTDSYVMIPRAGEILPALGLSSTSAQHRGKLVVVKPRFVRDGRKVCYANT